MKNIILTVSCAALMAGAAIGAEVVTTTTTSSGTLHEYTPGSTFVVKETTGPVQYRYSDKVTYVTKSGRVLQDAEVKKMVRVGRPVKVHYGMRDKDRYIEKIEIDDDGEVEVEVDDD